MDHSWTTRNNPQRHMEDVSYLEDQLYWSPRTSGIAQLHILETPPMPYPSLPHALSFQAAPPNPLPLHA